jgi:hypothetical protein
MCTCASCEYTDGFTKSGFAEWPRGNPAGRRSDADYAAHVRHARSGAYKTVPFSPGQPPRFSGSYGRREDPHKHYKFPQWDDDGHFGEGYVTTVAAYVKEFEKANGLRSVPIAKRVPPLVALARELRRAA